MKRSPYSALPVLVLASGCMFCMLFVPWILFEVSADRSFVLLASGFENAISIPVVDVEPMLPFTPFVLLSAGFYLAPLAFSRNPSRRRAFLSGAMMLSLLLLAATYITSNSFKAYLDAPRVAVEFLWPMALPVVAVMLGLAAFRFFPEAQGK